MHVNIFTLRYNVLIFIIFFQFLIEDSVDSGDRETEVLAKDSIENEVWINIVNFRCNCEMWQSPIRWNNKALLQCLHAIIIAPSHIIIHIIGHCIIIIILSHFGVIDLISSSQHGYSYIVSSLQEHCIRQTWLYKFFQNIFLVTLLISLSIDIWHESNSRIIQ